MSSSCLSSGGASAYHHRLEALDLDIIKSPSSTSWISSSSSPSSTLSDSSNCGRAISTRKPRTPRKRPNQTYNEAAAILSTAYPKIFPTASTKFPNYTTFLFEPSDLLIHVDVDKPSPAKLLTTYPCQTPTTPPPPPPPEISDEFDTESILDEEIGGGNGIESIMGNLQVEKQIQECDEPPKFCYGYPVGLGVGYGLRRAMRCGDDWWRFPCVNVATGSAETKKKKKAEEEQEEEEAGLHLNLNYEGVLRAWSDKPSPFSGESDARGRLAQIELLGPGGVREASVLRYKEKRRTRLFSKKIRYQVRKLNADRRPRMKGRFVRTPTSSDD